VTWMSAIIFVSYSPTNHNGSKYVDITVIQQGRPVFQLRPADREVRETSSAGKGGCRRASGRTGFPIEDAVARTPGP